MTFVLRSLIKRTALLAFKELADQTPLQVYFCHADGRSKIEIIEQTEEETKFIIRFPVIIRVKCLTKDFPRAKREVESIGKEETMIIAGLWYLNTLSFEDLLRMLKDIEEMATRTKDPLPSEVV